MPINAALEIFHKERFDILRWGKVSDCCPYVFAAGK